MSTFNPNWVHGHEYVPNDGTRRPARIVCYDRQSPVDEEPRRSIIALVPSQFGGEAIVLASKDGTCRWSGRLVNKPAILPRERWFNIYRDNICDGPYATERQAMEHRRVDGLIKTTCIAWEETLT